MEKYQTPLKKTFNKALDKYERLSKENPDSKFALDMAPGSGIATSLADSAVDLRKENYPDAALDLLGVVPGAKMVKAKGFLDKAKQMYGSGRANLARTTDKTSDAVTYVENKDAVAKSRGNGMKKGGKVSAPKACRGDGCAQRGKTKGRFV
jgi:hypothetical protein